MSEQPSYDYPHRLERARQLMSQSGLDALYVKAGPNMRYFAGWSAFVGGWPIWLSALILPASGDPTFLMSSMHNDIFQCTDSWLKDGDVRTHLDGDEIAGELREVLREKGLLGGRLGVEDDLGYAEYDLLGQADPNIQVQRAGFAFDSLRQKKDAGEVEAIRKATAITSVGHARAAEVVREGLPEYQAAMAMITAMLDGGAEDISCGMHGRFLKLRTTEFKRGDVVDIDMGARWDGYGCDYARTIFVGQPEEEYAKAYKLCAECFEATLEMVRPGIEAQEVHRFAINYMKKRAIWDGGWPVWKIGHGVGLTQVHEAPLVQDGATLILEPGMVFVIDPGCFIPNQERDLPIHIESPVVVTETGAEDLTTYTMDLVVV